MQTLTQRLQFHCIQLLEHASCYFNYVPFSVFFSIFSLPSILCNFLVINIFNFPLCPQPSLYYASQQKQQKKFNPRTHILLWNDYKMFHLNQISVFHLSGNDQIKIVKMTALKHNCVVRAQFTRVNLIIHAFFRDCMDCAEIRFNYLLCAEFDM